MNAAAFGALLAIVALLAGCGEDDDSATAPESVSYMADAGAESEEVMSVNGLTLEAMCVENAGQPMLRVTATTDTDNVLISSEFDGKNAPKGGYRFVLDDFDRDFGRWDFLGTNPDEVTGTLRYASPDGYVTVDFVADQGSAQADCVFSGVAVSATS
jgi:hypothetical protein